MSGKWAETSALTREIIVPHFLTELRNISTKIRSISNLTPTKPARPKQYWKAESAHYYNHEDHPLRVGNKLLTGKTHMPCPTKSLWFANANSILGNVKWHYNMVVNALPKIELIAVNEWWWSTSCEYADVVFGVDSWAELKHPDMTASVTNPFLLVFPKTPIPRIFNTMGDIEVYALVASKLAELTGDQRFNDYWKFVNEDRTDVYLQRILDHSTNTKGYSFKDLHEKAINGVPAIMNSRTTPKNVGSDQIMDSSPWYTKSGRLESYREEDEFIEAGENLPVHREPVDSTFYEPNIIIAPPHEAMRPKGPEDYGVKRDDLSCETRCGRNVVYTWDEAKKTAHPLIKDDYKFIFHTPKFRHGSHTTPIDTDMNAMLFGPFGDIYRHDKRSPFVTEGYVDINPTDAQELGVARRRLRLDRRGSRGSAVPRVAKGQEELRPRPAPLPSEILSGHAARRDAYVVQHVRCDARLAAGTKGTQGRLGKESADKLSGDVPFGLASIGNARLAKTDVDDRFAGAQRDVRAGHG